MFFLLYGLSMVPWFFAFFINDKQALGGLFVIDVILTFSAYWYLWWAMHWWSIVVIIGLAALGNVLEGIGVSPYRGLFKNTSSKKMW